MRKELFYVHKKKKMYEPIFNYNAYDSCGGRRSLYGRQGKMPLRQHYGGYKGENASFYYASKAGF